MAGRTHGSAVTRQDRPTTRGAAVDIRPDALFAPPGAPLVDALLRPLSTKNLAERISDRFVTAFALGEFVPGQRLPSARDLAGKLQVSRTSVREAIQRLEAGGFVTVRRGRNGGAFVVADWLPESADMIRRVLLPQWEQFEHLLEFRQLMEQQIARTAASRREEADISAMEDAVTAFAQAGDDREASRAADERLHAAVARATQNIYLADLSRRLRSAVTLGFGAEPYTAEVRQTAIQQHPQLVRAIRDEEQEEAASLAAEHFSLTTNFMLEELVARIRDSRPSEGF